MKLYHYLSVCAIALCAMACTQENKNIINVKVQGLDDGTKLALYIAATDTTQLVQTAELKNGEAQFTFDAQEPLGYRMAVDSTYGGYTLALGKGDKVEFTAKAEVTENNGNRFTAFTDAQVKGSPTHDSYLKKRPDRDKMNEAYEKYHADNKDILDRLSQFQRGSKDYEALTKTPEYEKFAKDEHDFFTMVESTIKGAIADNKDNWFGPFFMLTNYSYLTTENFPEYDQFTDEVKNSFYGKIIAEKVVPMATDEPMPDFEFTDHATGEKMSLYDICKKHKYVLLDFWASWCGPCRKEIPNFKAQYELYKDKGLQIVSISADANEADWLKALDEEKLEWPNDIDGDKGIANLYKVQFYPTVYLLDSEARVLGANDEVRGENLRNKLAELFK